MHRSVFGLVAVWAWAAVACTECETSQDCPSGQYQCIDGDCTLPDQADLPDLGFVPQNDVGFVDTGPDVGFVDAGVAPRDVGFPDSGVDGGVADVAPRDVGFGDAGLDAGTNPGPRTDVDALVEVSVCQNSLDGARQVAEGRFFDYSRSGRTRTVRTQGGCTIVETTAGTPVAIGAREIELRNGAAAIDLRPRFTPVRFVNPGPTTPRQLLEAGTSVRFTVLSTGVAGTLADATVTTPAPVRSLPALGLSFSTPNPQAAVNLAPAFNIGATRFEVYDTDRRKVVSCPVTVTTVGLPLFLNTVFARGAQVTLEVRSQGEATASVGVVGGAPVEVTFRAARGLCYPVTIQ